MGLGGLAGLIAQAPLESGRHGAVDNGLETRTSGIYPD